MAKEPIIYYDEDFLGNKINIGDKVIFEAPKYRDFVIGTVITKASKSCQIEYINDWNYSKPGKKEVVRQYYGQTIKHPMNEIVRCKDCKHATFYSCRNDPCSNRIICEYSLDIGDENHYCSCGERKV